MSVTPVPAADPNENADPVSGLHPSQLFHTGIVVEILDAGMAELGAALGLTWKGGRPVAMELQLYGEARTLTMRIAHSVQGPPHIELIQAIPDTPWALPAAAGVHHLCYWAEDSTARCAALEQAGFARVMGEQGSASGYFLSPLGIYIEILERDHHAALSRWLTGGNQ